MKPAYIVETMGAIGARHMRRGGSLLNRRQSHSGIEGLGVGTGDGAMDGILDDLSNAAATVVESAVPGLGLSPVGVVANVIATQLDTSQSSFTPSSDGGVQYSPSAGDAPTSAGDAVVGASEANVANAGEYTGPTTPTAPHRAPSSPTTPQHASPLRMILFGVAALAGVALLAALVFSPRKKNPSRPRRRRKGKARAKR